MRFSDIKVGESFRIDGELYRKVSPLIGSNLSGAQQKLFARSAVVELEGVKVVDEAPQIPTSIDGDELLRAVRQLQASIGQELQTRGDATDGIAKLFKAFRAQLKLPL
ncbi:MAG TPA: hypothetical protein EYN73_02545 [Chromatiaceae bacterium]|jgi:hypothetical protein|nr:hypothetical protein [Chromatiaceae bacterium]HIN82472.1 hypothetical protein [Chromatiales bacterium]HIA07956.1 hypothetical protein [Chromatiaceae bacterium]HIB85193.1 hypothetical protein [Chromatiaceae bacterium]HIO15055.1 hypothetical protein [Chromatiales bacterium]